MARLTDDEARALALIALLFMLAAAARFHGASRADAAIDAALLDPDSLGDVATERTRENEERSRPLEPRERIDVNTASPVQLDRLPGVGPALADAIVADRDASGPFQTLADLDRVSGIGPATLRRLAPHVRTAAGAGGRAGAGEPGRRPVPAGTQRSPRSTLRGSGQPRQAVPHAHAPAPAPASVKLDLNHASAEALEKLPGIGPALAARIIHYRDSVGGFGTVEELEAVRGIGPVLLSRLQMFVKVRK